jgi:hypothetical protein
MALSNKAYAMALNHVPDPPDPDPHCLAFKISKSESLIHKSTRADNTTTVIPSKQLITTISVTDPDPSRFGSFYRIRIRNFPRGSESYFYREIFESTPIPTR